MPARNALLADVVPPQAYGRAYGIERAMDNLGAIGGPLLALVLVAAFGVRSAILISVVPGLLSALAILYATRSRRLPGRIERRQLRIRVQPILRGELRPTLLAAGAFELGNVAATF